MPSTLTVPEFTLDDQNLTAEAEKIAKDAAQPLKDWIEKSVNTLANKTMAQVSEAATALQKNIDEIDKLLATSQARYQAIQDDFQKLSVTFNDDDLKHAAATLKAATEAATKELEDQRQKYRDTGKQVGQLAINALKTAFL